MTIVTRFPPSPTGMMLHASRIVVPRDTKAPISADAPIPDRFAAFGFADMPDGLF